MRPEEAIEGLIRSAIARPLMHGRTVREFESWVLALFSAWEAAVRLSPDARTWFDHWRAECRRLGLDVGETLADAAKSDDWQARFRETASALDVVFTNLKAATP